jgi:trehalose 6-phosphate synthase
LVSDINGQYCVPGWTPIVYLHRCLSRPELVAFYRAADIALVTPLKDGMNLVAKEFCASRVDDGGVLVLSEFAGAAKELKGGALLVNPYDTEGVAFALYRAFRMSGREQRVRMQRMRRWIQRHEVFRWCESFCSQATPFRFNAKLPPGAVVPIQLPALAASGD